MPRGGTRPGAGRPKGTKNAETLSKEAAREVARQRILADLEPMLAAQIIHAKGLKYLVTRDKKTGKFIRVGPALASSANEETIEVWEKDPSVQAFTDLMNRALDKAKEQEQEISLRGSVDVVSVLRERHRRRLGSGQKALNP